MRKRLFGVLAAGLLTVSVAGTGFAAGPDPSGNNPWDACTEANGGAPTCFSRTPNVEDAQACETKSGAPGHWLWNTNSFKAHCFRN